MTGLCPLILGYLDPGSGSVLLQVVLGSLAASGVVITLLWQRVRGFVARVLGRKSTPADDQKK